MRIDPCKGCGELIDIASDHAPGCPTRHNHFTREIRPAGECPACDYPRKQAME